ncbi:hypothetical protein [Streptomyces sp. NPDC050121]|uniref:hypothetical protein n=1 Tax=Streptomyces sp. NPDC050121 TaxID=3365601 RepID=UPI0037AA7574
MGSVSRISFVAKIAVTAVFAAGAAVAVAPAASATNGNKVFNCWGQYFSTSWQQTCGSAGASKTGLYHSIGTCSFETDNDITVARGQGSTGVRHGEDCTFNVSSVVTEYYGG